MLSCVGVICTADAGDSVLPTMCSYAAIAPTMTVRLIVSIQTYSGQDTES